MEGRCGGGDGGFFSGLKFSPFFVLYASLFCIATAFTTRRDQPCRPCEVLWAPPFTGLCLIRRLFPVYVGLRVRAGDKMMLVDKVYTYLGICCLSGLLTFLYYNILYFETQGERVFTTDTMAITAISI